MRITRTVSLSRRIAAALAVAVVMAAALSPPTASANAGPGGRAEDETGAAALADGLTLGEAYASSVEDDGEAPLCWIETRKRSEAGDASAVRVRVCG